MVTQHNASGKHSAYGEQAGRLIPGAAADSASRGNAVVAASAYPGRGRWGRGARPDDLETDRRQPFGNRALLGRRSEQRRSVGGR